MLSDASRPVVEATLPAVGANIGEIARRFYPHMFGAHPELLDGMFNRGNQARGEQQQSLAGSVASFATALLETPPRTPESLLRRIAHKHASLGIRADQYQIVHDNLMWAIVDVLGDAVTPQVAAAWDEVYWLMANALINQERGLYSARGVRPETVWRPWQVESKIRETADVVTFVVRRIDDRLVKTSLPGQYVTVKVLMPDGVHQPRQYSLTRADDGEHRHFSVKRVTNPGEPDGEVSTLLHDIGRRRRSADPVAALRRRRPRRRGAPGRVLQRRHRHRPDGRHDLPPRRGEVRALDHAAARRRRRGVVRAAPPGGHRRARVEERGAARLVREGRQDHRAARRRVRRHDGSRRRSTSPTTPPTTCAGRCRSCSSSAAACSSAGCRRATSSTRCSAPTCGRPTWTDNDTPVDVVFHGRHRAPPGG